MCCSAFKSHASVHTTMRYVHWVAGYRDIGIQHCELLETPESQQ